MKKHVKIETPRPVTKLPAHERAARRRRVLGDLPTANHKSVPRPKALAPTIPASLVQHHLSY